MKARATLKLPTPRHVHDPFELVLQVVGLRWIPMSVCQPPAFVEFIGLVVKGPHDYTVSHNRFDGSGSEGLEHLTHWFPCPSLPVRAAAGFPPHERALGAELEAALRQWATSRR